LQVVYLVLQEYTENGIIVLKTSFPAAGDGLNSENILSHTSNTVATN